MDVNLQYLQFGKWCYIYPGFGNIWNAASDQMCILNKFPSLPFPWVSPYYQAFPLSFPLPISWTFPLSRVAALLLQFCMAPSETMKGWRKRGVYPQSTLLYLSQTQENSAAEM